MGASDAMTDLPCLLFVAMTIRGGGSLAAILELDLRREEGLVF
jgi:hypothetical protein